ncbi:tetratricopeptide repeat protein [Aquimarina litoralis]|uniref:tetratricopeptide repeat protein n=1 Tax=Aquimarina litoralis TaxID=584605 RepID=UPI001C591BD4|nr:tetratricopeptide repeat protein [Aquimarina litoralis]MBW1296325.1 tetratricopeptide repeat protein [Aquimarina litoralis]
MKNISLLIAILLSQFGFCQNFQSEFLKYCQTKDTLNQLRTLEEWKKINPNDPELYTSYFNYHFSKSRKEVIALTTDQPNGQSLVIKDSLNKTAGFLGSEIHYDKSELQKGISKIDEGIKNYPNRLDMRFGKIYVLGQTKDWQKFTSEIIKTIQYSSKNKNNWTWTNNETRKDGENFFLSALQDYQLQLYNTGDNKLLDNMKEIANEVLKFYPNHIESLSNLSITYLLTKEYDKALVPLYKAEKLNPKDYILLSNIAQAYKLKGEKQKAIEYYKKTIEFGDDRAKKYAKQQITELKK